MQAQQHDLILLSDTDEASQGLAKTLRAEGFTVRCYATPREVLDSSGSATNPILVVLAPGSGAKAMKRRVRDLLETRRLYSFPLVLVGSEFVPLEPLLGKIFRAAVTVTTPFDTTDFMYGLELITARLTEAPMEFQGITRSKPVEPTEAFTLPEIPTAEETQSVQEILELLKEGEADEGPFMEFGSFPELMFQSPHQRGLLSHDLGGARYPFCGSDEFLLAQDHLPLDPKAQGLSEKLCGGLQPWQSTHLHRVAYLASKMLEGLTLPPEMAEATKAASFLQAIAWNRQADEIFRGWFFAPEADALRMKIASRTKDSAILLATDHGLPIIGRVVATVGQLLARESVSRDDEHQMSASAVFASELIDRACWSQGHWRPTAANSLLKKIREGGFPEIHPYVTCCAVKMLVEAIAATPIRRYGWTSLDGDPAGMETARKLREDRIDDREQRIPLNSLAPGMKLSRPLFAFNGKQLLQANLTLDDDLIYRIWSISSLLAVNPALVFSQEEGEEKSTAH